MRAIRSFLRWRTRAWSPISSVTRKSRSPMPEARVCSASPVFICMQGEAKLIRAKAEFEAHWVRDLERWFQNGVDTPGLVLIKVRATRIHYWDGENEGEVVV